jgi:type IV pilus assembly protein PilE
MVDMSKDAWKTWGRSQAGITLIELLVVVAIIAILASVAYPSYQEYIRRAARAQAEGILLENAQFLERNYTLANRYDLDNAGAAVVIPFATSPKPGEGAARYNISVSAAAINATDPNQVFPASGAQVFTLQAVPVAADDCGTLLVSETGARGVTGVGATVANCWRQ